MTPARLKLLRIVIVVVIVTAVVAGAATAYMVMTGHGRSSLTSVNPDRMRFPVRGIDVSSHNGSIDFEAVAADSIDFVIVKATEGATFKDRMFATNVRCAQKAGLPVGAYHFFRFDTPGHMQALNFINSVRGHKLSLPFIVDIEEWGNPTGIPTETILARLNEMIGYMRLRGYEVMLYTNKDGYARFVEHFTDSVGLWICSFTDPPGPDKWHLWQHSHRERVAGVAGAVDMNTFNGSRDDWEAWLAGLRRL